MEIFYHDDRLADALTSAHKCAKAIEAALKTMDPSLEVHSGVLRLIVDFEALR